MAPDRTLNPFASVTTARERGEIVALTIVAPVNGRGLQTTTFKRQDGEDRFRAVRRAVLGALFEAQTRISCLLSRTAAGRGLTESRRV